MVFRKHFLEQLCCTNHGSWSVKCWVALLDSTRVNVRWDLWLMSWYEEEFYKNLIKPFCKLLDYFGRRKANALRAWHRVSPHSSTSQPSKGYMTFSPQWFQVLRSKENHKNSWGYLNIKMNTFLVYCPEAKIDDLDLVIVVYQYILWFKIPMSYLTVMQIFDSCYNLLKNGASLSFL